MQLTLQKFDLSKLTCDKISVILGKRQTGKSYLARNILYYLKDVPNVTVVGFVGRCSSNIAVGPYYADLVPQLSSHCEYTQDIIESTWKNQRCISDKSIKETIQYGKSLVDPRAVLILDDCIFDQTFMHDENTRRIFCNIGRLRLHLIITMQYPITVPHLLRSNIDYVFMFRHTHEGARKKIYENYAAVFDTYEDFCNILDQYTGEYRCLVIDNTARSNKLEDIVFWYVAEDPCYNAQNIT